MHWEKKPVEAREVKNLAARYETDLLTSTILLRRDVRSPGDLCFFLEDDIFLLHNPFLFVEMEEAVDRINAAIDSEEKIHVYGDRDVDGITSTVLLTERLKSYGASVTWGLPAGDDAYGLTEDVIEGAVSNEVGLIITVDCGISNKREVDLARENGVDVIIIDHHNAGSDLPVPAALVNPKLEDSGYPFRDLAACSVVLKLDWALRFSRTRFYGETLCLLFIKPLNQTFQIDAVKVTNLVEVDRIREHIAPGTVSYGKTKIAAFLSGLEVYTLDKDTQQNLVTDIFTDVPDISLFDLKTLVDETYPELSGKSLLSIREENRFLRYQEPELDEIGVLVRLFSNIMLKREGFLEDPGRLDLVALATLADIMPLVNENRILVKAGLAQLSNSAAKQFRPLLFKTGLLGKRIGARAVAWQLSPVINATGRMGEPEKAVRLFLSEREEEIDELTNEVIQLNERRKKLGSETWNSILPLARESFENSEEKFVMVSGDSIHRGITGLMAARLVSFFKVPALVLSLTNERPTGSLRSPQGHSVRSFLDSFNDLFVDYGGHDFAAGFTLHQGKLPDFEARYNSVIMNLPNTEKQTVQESIFDAEIPFSYLTPDLWKVVLLFEPYGEANPQLTFLTRQMKILNCEVIGKRESVHLKLLLDSGQFKWPAVYWNASEKLGVEFEIGENVDVVYHLTKNYYGGAETFQLVVLDINR